MKKVSLLGTVVKLSYRRRLARGLYRMYGLRAMLLNMARNNERVGRYSDEVTTYLRDAASSVNLAILSTYDTGEVAPGKGKGKKVKAYSKCPKPFVHGKIKKGRGKRG